MNHSTMNRIRKRLGQFRKLLEPVSLKRLHLKNRIVKSAQWLVYAEADGSVGDRLIAFYRSIARGGVGLLTVEESVCQYPEGASNMPHIRLDDDRLIPGLSRLARAIHDEGCPAVVQITHAGPAHSPAVAGTDPVAPSRLDPPVEPVFAPARQLSVPQIHDMVAAFAQSALRVQQAGFDGVELHMAHYALVNAFLSRIQNKRRDEYGCDSLENRARFSREIIERTRELTGPDFLIGIRMCGREWGHEFGTSVEEATAFARIFEAAGADYLQVSAYGYGPFALCAMPELVTYPEATSETRDFVKRIRRGALLPEAAQIRKAVSIPVSGVGHIDPAAAERALRQGEVDLICMGRPLLVDPELPNKLVENRIQEIRPCLRCNVCLHHILLAQPAHCRLNPALGRESELAPLPERDGPPKRVLIAGGGPAGLEAARVAAERGHEVHLCDAARAPGGLMPLAAFIKGTRDADDLGRALKYYRRQLKRLGVVWHGGRKIDEKTIQKLKPDALILATGGAPVASKIPGANKSHVMKTDQLRRIAAPFVRLFGPALLNRLSRIYLPLGKRVAIVGGGLAGLEAAEFLTKRGRQVTVIEETEQAGAGMPLPWLVRLLPWLAKRGAQLLTNTRCVEIVDGGVHIRKANGETRLVSVDSVLIVTRYERDEAGLQRFAKLAPEVHRIGDANAGENSGFIEGAIADGARTAASL